MKRGGRKMAISEVLNKISGVQTIESIKSALKIDRTKAIYIIYRLRKRGYVITKQDAGNTRVYFISRENILGGKSYLDVLNKYSPIKLSSSEVYKIYGREVSIEETLVYALKTRKFRYILSSLALFKRIKNWKELYRLGKRNNILREIGALYELAENILPRIKKINKVFLNHSLPNKTDNFRYIIPHLKSKDFLSIENKWKMHIPFNRTDLVEYKT